ncbi:hypothetical protein FF1_044799 [Malus domestica]
MNYKSNPTRPIPRVPTPIFRNTIVRRMCCARIHTHTDTAVPFSASSLYQHNNQTTTLFLSHLFPRFNFNPW